MISSTLFVKGWYSVPEKPAISQATKRSPGGQPALFAGPSDTLVSERSSRDIKLKATTFFSNSLKHSNPAATTSLPMPSPGIAAKLPMTT